MEEPIPTAAEIEEQLDRMLVSKRFRNAQNQADFLDIVVRRFIEGKKTTEEIIGRKLFGPKFKKDESSDVRVTAISLRSKLHLYQENEGREEPVSILLPEPSKDRRIKAPPGEAYRPIITYNPQGEIAKEYQLGIVMQDARRPHELTRAGDHFQRVLSLSPHHVGARIGIVEILCSLAMMGWCASEFIGPAVQEAAKAVAAGPHSWHAHAATGAALLLGGSKQKAARSFERALALNKKETLRYGWFHAYLLAAGHQKEALILARQRAKIHPERSSTAALYAAHLYASREYTSATKVLEEVIENDPMCWTARLVFALVKLACTDAFAASLQLQYMEVALVLVEGLFTFPGLTALIRGDPKTTYGASTLATALRQITQERSPCPVQTALFFLVIEQREEAVRMLYKAWLTFEPIVLFLPVLPIFDALRDSPDFQTLSEGRFASRADILTSMSDRGSHTEVAREN